MLQLKVVEGGLVKTLSLDMPGVVRPQRVKALSGGKYAVAIPVEGEALANFPPGYVMKRVGNNLVLVKDGQEMLVLEGFFALEPIPEFRLEYDDELLLISAENVDAYPTEGILFDSFAADVPAEAAAASEGGEKNLAAWLLGLAGMGALGAALGGGGKKKDPPVGPVVPEPEGRPEPALRAPGVLEMDNGAINAAEAADGTIVQIPGYAGMQVGDIVALNWNGSVLTHVVTAADVAAGHVVILVPVDKLGPDGSFQADYTVSGSDGKVLGTSPSAPVVIDRVAPGLPGDGIDNPDTSINENLAAPILDEMDAGVINAAEAADGTVVRIPGYANMEAGDTIRLDWNGVVIEYTVLAEDVARGHVEVPVDQGLLVDGSFEISYTVTDLAGNSSGASPSSPVVIDRTIPGAPGSGTDDPNTPVNENLPAPIIDEMDGSVISGTEAADGTVVRIPQYSNMEAGDTIRLDWNGTAIDYVVTAADVANGEVRIPVDHTLLADGSFTIDYAVTDRNGNASGTSPSAPVVIDTTAPLPPVVTAISDDTGLSTSDGVTRDNTLVISGTAEADALVTVMIDGTVIGSVLADGSGNWSYDHTGVTLADGDYKITAIQSDKAGNPSGPSGEFNVTVDTDNGGTTPLTPPVVTAISDDTGLSTSDGVTRDNTLVISGTAEADALVTVMIDGTVIGSVLADGSGNWSYDHTGVTLADGDYKITAIQSDKAGNPSGPSGEFNVTVDTDNGGTTPLTPPVVTAISDDTGLSTSDGVTRDNTLVISGTAEADALVTVMIDGTVIGSVLADGSGNWSYDHTGVTLADGDYKITAIQSDKAGNPSGPSGEFNVTVDTDNGGTTPLTPPVVTAISDDTGLSTSDGVTRDNTLVISGTAEADALVTVMIDGTVIGSVLADGSGNWSYDHTGVTLADGDYKITAIQSDKAGNPSGPSGEFNVTVDTDNGGTTPLTPPVVTAISDDTGLSTSDGVTRDNTLVISGTAEADALVTVMIDGTVIGSVLADGSGNWSYDHTGVTLADGDYKITAIQSDKAGNPSGPSGEFNVTVDTDNGGTTPLTPPVVTAISDDTGLSTSDGVTRDNTLVISGTAEADALVTVMIDGTVIGSVLADGSGNWSYDHTGVTLADGDYKITAIQSDKAGNPSGPSGEFNVTVDTDNGGTTPLTPPVVTAISDDTGLSTSDGVTRDNTLVISGTAEADALVTVMIDGTVIGSVLADGSGNWSYDHTGVTLADGDYKITAIQSDKAGNPSGPSGEFNVTVDTDNGGTTPLTPPVVTAISDDTGLSTSDGVTRDNTLVISGTAEADALVTVMIDGTVIGSVLADGSGNWSYDHTGVTLADGDYKITAIQSDKAGNPSGPSGEFNVTVDTDNGGTTPLTPPVVTAISDDTGLSTSDGVTRDNTLVISGTAEADALVTVMIDGTVIGSVLADGSGNWSYDHTGVTLADGDYKITAIQSDKAGNPSGPSGEFNVTVDTDNGGTTPLTPPVVTAISDDTGLSTSDGVTRDNTLVISGTAEADALVTVMIDGTVIGSVLADGSGNWSYDHTGVTLADGDYKITAIQSDKAGNPSGPSGEFNVTVDTDNGGTTPLTPPVVTAISDDTGLSTSDGVTRDNTLVISGTAEADALVTVMIDGTVIGSVLADGSGNWSYDHTGVTLADGDYKITAIQSDKAGNPSGPSGEFNVTVDTDNGGTTPLTPPVVTAISDDTGLSTSDGVTRDNTLVISGTAEADALVTVMIDGTVIGSVLADGSGNWSYDHTGVTLADGDYKITAIQSDKAGNPSGPSGEFNVTVDTDNGGTTPLTPPVVTAISDDTGLSTSDGVTRDNTLVISGTAEADALVTVMIDGTVIGSVLADGSGNWSYDHTGVTLADGDYKITAIQSDKAGNPSGPSGEFNVTVDTGVTPLAPPAIVTISDDTGVSTSDGVTHDNTLTLTGTAEGDALVTVMVDGVVVGSVQADGSGNWTFTTPTLGEGKRDITASQTDLAGNVSAASPPVSMTIDTLVAPPTIVTIGDDTGASGSDRITQDNTLTLTGTAEGGATVFISVDNVVIGSVVADSAGNWNFTTSALAEGDRVISTSQTDVAGNVSAASPPVTMTIDTLVTPPTIVTVSDDTGVSTSDGVTHDNTLTLTGTAEGDALVTVMVDGVVVGSVQADGSGNWAFTTPTLGEGKRDITASQTDLAGNVSAASPPVSMTIDTLVAPPTIVTIGDDTGASGSDRITQDNTLTLTGTAEGGATVFISVDNVVIGSVVADSAGNWNFTTGALAEGDRVISTSQTDVAGNVSAASPPVTMTIDTLVTPPTIVTVSDDTGVSGSDQITHDNTLTIAGKAEAGATVQVLIGGAAVGSVIADVNGNWTFTTLALSDGEKSITVKQTDVAGNVSSTSAPYIVTIDTQVAAPTIDSVGTDTGVSGSDKITSDATLEIQGKAEPGATVFITIDSMVVGSAVADPSGQWRFTTTALTDGEKSITATQTDVAGNVSGPSTEYKMTVDTTVQAPTIDSVGSDTGVLGDRITADNTLFIQGRAEPGALVDVRIDGASVGTVVADASGQWTIVTSAQADGPRVITAVQTDVAGNTSQPSTDYAITIDTAVLPPTIISVGSDSGVPGDRITNDNTLQIQGKAEPGATVDVRINNTSIGSAVADANGNWTFTTSALPDGDKLISAAQTDVAGNVSAASPPYTMTIDTQVLAPTIESVGTDTGVSNTDNITNDATLEIKGKAEGGATVEVLIGGTKVGTAIADINGNWTFTTSAQSDGTKSITAIQIDLAGNTSPASPPYMMTVDTQVAAPIIDSVGSDTGVLGDRITADSTLEITGRAEPGATVEVRIDSFAVGTAIADSFGNWTLVTASQSDGIKSITAVQTDVAGNVSQASPPYSMTIDTQVAPPTITSIGTDTGVPGDRITSDNTLQIQGKAEPGASVEIRIDNMPVGTVIADINGNWNFTTASLADGDRKITATQTDVAGNVSQPSTQYPFTIDTQVVPPTIDNVGTDTNVVGDRITNDNTLFIEGVAEVGATVEVRVNGIAVGTALADASGRWTYTTAALADGTQSVSAIQTDLAGNRSQPSTAYDVTIDTAVLAPTIDSVGTDTGVVGDRITADNTLDIQGRAEPGATVEVRVDGFSVGTAIAGANGIWTLTTLALTDGTKSITAVQTDVAGNVSPPSTAYGMTINTGGTLQPPTIDTVGEDTGVSGSDRITKDNTLDIVGSAEPDATVDVYIGGSKVGSTVADSFGIWRFTTPGQSDGTKLISAIQTDVAGNVSPASPPYSVTIDTQVAAPTIDGVLNDTGVLGDGVTADNTLQVSGKAEPGALVEVRIDGTLVGSAVADLNGEWRLTTPPQGDGPKSITAIQTDVAGNTSVPSTPYPIRIDTQIAPPTIESVGNDTGYSNTDRVTNDNTLEIQGKAEPGATVDVRIDGMSVGTAIADVNGTWRLTTSTQADGVRSITATQTDVAGNVSQPSPPYAMTIDTVALPPTIESVTNDTGLAGDRVTSDNTLTIQGSAEPGATVEVRVDGFPVGTAIADGSGKWTFTTSGLSDGTRAITARQTDTAGNVSQPSTSYDVVVDTQVLPPTIESVSNDTGVSGTDKITSDNTLEIRGKAEPGASVQVLVDGNAVGVAIADINGNWSFTTSGLADGQRSITAIQTDVAGNVSPASPAYVMRIDTQVAAPTIDSVGTDTGASSTDRITSDRTLEIQGQAEPGATIDVRVDGVSVGSAIADINGIWRFTTPAQTDGDRTITAVQTDVAGNVSVPSAAYVIKVDTQVTAPTIESVGTDSGVIGDRITNDSTLEIRGKAEPGASVEVRIDGQLVGTVIADGQGNWLLTTSSLSDGNKSITASQTDLAGNVSSASPPYSVRIDTQVAAPTIESVGSDSGIVGDRVTNDNTLEIRGKAEPGASVDVRIDGASVGTVIADGTGDWVLVTSTLGDGNKSITAVQTDVAGNVSGPSNAYTVTVDTLVLAPTIESVGTDTGVSATDKVTRDNTLEVQGKAEPGATVEVFVDGSRVGTAVADASGTWRMTTPAQSDGTKSITAIQTDVAGNVSPASPPVTMVIDTVVAAPIIDSVGTDTGVIGDRITADNTLEIVGRAEPGASVDVRINGSSIGTAIADAGGVWRLTTAPLPDGLKSITAVQTDVAGNVSLPSSGYDMTINTGGALLPPTIDTVGTDTGMSATDKITNDNTLEIRGAAQAGATVEVSIDGMVVGTAIADGSGQWFFVTGVQTDGTKAITAVQTDVAGNRSGVSPPYSVTVDTQVLPPTIESVGTDTGVSNTDGITRDNTLEIHGKAEPGATVYVTVDGSIVGSVIADGIGNWTFTTPPLAEGAKEIRATQTDVAGNASPASPPVTMTVDTVVAAPIIDSVGTDSGVSGTDKITNDNTLEIVGRAEGGATVTVTVNGAVVGSVIADASGNWRLTTSPLTDGVKEIRATQTDVAGNSSVASPPSSMTIDTAALAPTIDSVGTDTGASGTDRITNDNTLDIHGRGEPGALVVVRVDGVAVGSVIANGSGHWTLANVALSDGVKSITAVQTDVAGNQSPASSPYTMTIDTAVVAPTIDSVGTDTGVSGTDGITNDKTLTVTGQAENGAIVHVTVDGSIVGSVVADSSGRWTFTTPALADGDRVISATQTDVAGNVSVAAPPVQMTIDSTVAPPIIDTVGTDTGASSTDRITNDNTVEISGRAEGGATVEVRIGGVAVGTAIANASGQWTFTTSGLTDGVKDITAVQTDVAGNQSSPSSTYSITVDTQVLAPTIEYVGTDTGVQGDRITADNTLEIRGKAEPGASVDVRINGLSVATVIADGSGNWTFTTTPLSDGLKSITAVQTDVAGNQSLPSTAYEMTVNAGASLLAPVIDSVGTDTGASSTDRITNDKTLEIHGQAESGATVEVRINGLAVGSVVADNLGRWTFTTSPQSDGVKNITVVQTDVAGNQSPTSPPYTMTIDSTVAPPIIDTVGTDTGSSSTDRLTNDNTLEITGRAEAGATVEVRINGTVVGTAIANTSGVWTLTTPAQSDGAKSITATQTDVAGNASVASPPYSMTIDTTAAAPTIESVGTDTGVLGDRITSDNTLEIAGKAEDGATVYVTIDGTVVGSVIADGSGNWTFITSALTDGAKVISASQSDRAGNISAASPPYTMTIDTTPVSSGDLLAPIVDEMSGGKISETEALDGTIVRIPGYLGMVAGDVIHLNWNGTTITQAVTAADVAAGAVQINVPPEMLGPDGTFKVDYTVVDAAGNSSGKSPGTDVVLDAVPPPPPGPINDLSTSNRAPAITMLADGGWLVVHTGTEGGRIRLYQQRFDAGGNKVSSSLVNDTVIPHSANGTPIVIGLADGGWVVSMTNSATNTAVVQQFNKFGEKVGAAKDLPSLVSGMVALPNGNWLVKAGASLIEFNASGNQVEVDSVQTSNGHVSAAAFDQFILLADGSKVVHYMTGFTSGESDVYRVHYNADGTVRTASTLVYGGAGQQEVVDTAALKNGGWVLLAYNSATTKYELQRYGKDGSLEDTRVHNAATGLVRENDLLALDDGGWLVIWREANGANGYDLYQQCYSSAGIPGAKVLITEGVFQPGHQQYQNVTLMDDGGWLVVWSGPGPGASGDNVYQRRYDAQGNAVALDGSGVTTFSLPEVQAFAEVPEDTMEEIQGEPIVAQSAAESSSSKHAPDALTVEDQLLAQLLATPTHAEPEAKPALVRNSVDTPKVAASDEDLVEQALAQLSGDDSTAPTTAEPDEALLAEAMQGAQEPETLDGLLDGVIGEPAPEAIVSAPQVHSEPVLVMPPKTDEFESDDGLTLR